MSSKAFFVLHRDLPRQGPGEEADIKWLGGQIELAADARIADLACGPGADISALLDLAKDAEVTAIDRQPHFIDAARANWGSDPRVQLRCADMVYPGGPYDLIWCAGAVYILGIRNALELWRTSLKPGGVIAFSEPCFWHANPPANVSGIWQEYAAMSDADGVSALVTAAGFDTLATRRLSTSAWENYYGPLEERTAGLRENADPALARILDATTAEIAAYREFGDQFGYLLSVVAPI